MKLMEDNLDAVTGNGSDVTVIGSVVAGKVGRTVYWIRTPLLEGSKGTSIGRFGSDVGWIQTFLLEGVEGTLIERVGMDVDWIQSLLLDGDWKGRRLEGLEGTLDVVVDCSDQRCC